MWWNSKRGYNRRHRLGGRKDGEKRVRECDVDDHHYSVVSKLLGALALVTVIKEYR